MPGIRGFLFTGKSIDCTDTAIRLGCPYPRPACPPDVLALYFGYAG